MALWKIFTLKCCYSVYYGVGSYSLITSWLNNNSLDKVELVKDVIVLLARHLESDSGLDNWIGMPVERFFKTDASAFHVQKIARHKPQYTSLFAARREDDR